MNFSAGESGSRQVHDCRVDGDKVACTVNFEPLPDITTSFSGEFSGTLSELTLTGTETARATRSYEGCLVDSNHSTPISYVFNSNGSVTANAGTGQNQTSSSCTESRSYATPGGSVTGTWSAIQ